MNRIVSFRIAGADSGVAYPCHIDVSFCIYAAAPPVMVVAFVQHKMLHESSRTVEAMVTLHEERVRMGYEDTNLVMAANSCDSRTAESIAMDLFWRHAVLPSVEPDSPGWLREHAPEYWRRAVTTILREREAICREVQDE